MFGSGSHHQFVYGHVPIYGGRVQRKREGGMIGGKVRGFVWAYMGLHEEGCKSEVGLTDPILLRAVQRNVTASQ